MKIHWHEEEQQLIVEDGAPLLAAGHDALSALHGAQGRIAADRRKTFPLLSQTPPHIIAAMYARYVANINNGVDPRLEKMRGDYEAAQALLEEQGAALTDTQARLDDVTRQLTDTLRRLDAMPTPMSMLTDALTDIGVAIARRVVAETSGNAGGPGAPAVTSDSITKALLDGIKRESRDAPPPTAAVVKKPRIVIFAGAEEPTRSDEKWSRQFPDVTLRVERARADGRCFIPRGYDAAILVHGCRHATSAEVRTVYSGAPIVQRIDVPGAIGSIVVRLKGAA